MYFLVSFNKNAHKSSFLRACVLQTAKIKGSCSFRSTSSWQTGVLSVTDVYCFRWRLEFGQKSVSFFLNKSSTGRRPSEIRERETSVCGEYSKKNLKSTLVWITISVGCWYAFKPSSYSWRFCFCLVNDVEYANERSLRTYHNCQLKKTLFSEFIPVGAFMWVLNPHKALFVMRRQTPNSNSVKLCTH